MESRKRKRKHYANLYTSIDSQKINNDQALTDKDWSQGRVVKPVMMEEELDYPYDADDGPDDYYDYYLDNVSFECLFTCICNFIYIINYFLYKYFIILMILKSPAIYVPNGRQNY